jgi:hypothetical protein
MRLFQEHVNKIMAKKKIIYVWRHGMVGRAQKVANIAKQVAF